MVLHYRLKILLLIIGFINFQVVAQVIDIKSESSIQSDSSILLNTAVVKAYQVSELLQKIPGNLSVLKSDALTQADANNLAMSINSVPGVNMQSGTYSTNRIVIRGMGSRTPYNSNRIRSYLNEIPLTSSDGISTPEEVDLQSLERVEIIKGPSSALYGSGLGGSINMFSPSIIEKGGNISLQYGSFNTSKVQLAGAIKSNNGNSWLSLSNLQSDGYRENNKFRKTSLITTSQWQSSKWSISSTLLIIDVDAGIPSSLGTTAFETKPQTAAPSWKAVEGFEKYLKGVAGINLENKISDQIDNQFILFGKWNNAYEKRPFNNLDDQSISSGFINKLTYHTSKTEWVIGTEFNNERYEWQLDIQDSIINKNREIRNQVNLFAISYFRPNPKLNMSIAAAFNYAAYQLVDMYETNGDQSGEHQFPFIFSPRFGFNYAPNNGIAFYASAGQGFSLPSPEETLLPQGDINTDIEPELGMQYEVGSRLNLFKKKMEIEVGLYWIELNNLLVTKRVSEDVFTGINAGETRHQGFEIQMQNKLFDYAAFPGKLNAGLSFTASVNRFIDFTDDSITYDGNYLPGIPNQIGHFQITWNPLHFIELYYGLQFSGNQYLNDSNTMEYGSYVVSNIKVSTLLKIKSTSKLHFYLGLNNIGDVHYASMLVVNAIGFGKSEPRYYYPGLPRNAYAGIKFVF